MQVCAAYRPACGGKDGSERLSETPAELFITTGKRQTHSETALNMEGGGHSYAHKYCRRQTGAVYMRH